MTDKDAEPDYQRRGGEDGGGGGNEQNAARLIHEKARENKEVFAVVGVVAAAVLVAVFFWTFVLGLGDEVGQVSEGDFYGTQTTEVEVGSGSVTVESEDADEEFSALREMLDGYGAELEAEERTERRGFVTYSATVRVPEDEFGEFVDAVREEFDVTESEVGYETVDTTESRNDAEVLREGIELYGGYLDRLEGTEEGELDSETVAVVAEITDERLSLARELNEVETELGETERDAEMSVLEIRFREETDEPLTETFRDEIRSEVDDGLESVSSSVAGLVALPLDAVAILLSVVRYGVYAGVAASPLLLGFFAYRRFGEKEST